MSLERRIVNNEQPLTDYTEQQLQDALYYVRLKSNSSIEVSADINLSYNDNTKEIILSSFGEDIHGYSSITIPVTAVKKIKIFFSCFVADENGEYKFTP